MRIVFCLEAFLPLPIVPPLFLSSGDGLLSSDVGSGGGGGAGSGNKDLGQGPLNIALDVYPMAEHEVASQSKMQLDTIFR